MTGRWSSRSRFCRRCDGDPSIHFAAQPRHVGHLEAIQVYGGQSRVGNEPIDPPVQVAAAAEDVLDGVETVLPAGDLLIVEIQCGTHLHQIYIIMQTIVMRSNRLFVPQRHYRIDLRRTPRGYV